MLLSQPFSFMKFAISIEKILARKRKIKAQKRALFPAFFEELFKDGKREKL